MSAIEVPHFQREMVEAASFWDLVILRSALTPHALLAVDELGRRLTFQEYAEAAERAAAGLHALGVGRDTPVSWQLPTWLESLVLAGALARLEAVQNPIIPLNRQREVGFMLDQLGSELLIVPRVWRGYDYSKMARAIAEKRPETRILVVDRDLPTGDPATLPPWRHSGDETRWIMYTSGTTADPKGARHTDRSLMHSARGMCQRMHMTAEDRNAIAFPFTHIGGLTLLFADLIVGSASILLEMFTPEGIDVLSAEGVTLAGSGTPFNLAYLEAQQRRPDVPLFPRIKAFPGGGSSRPANLHSRLVEVFGVGLLSGYGLTETGFLAFADLDDPDEAKALTEGRAYPECELRIVDADGLEVSRGHEGEICARGPMVMQGYVDASLDVAFDDDGFFHTGDLGILNEDGYLTITGRLKEIIIRKGENISALEIENLVALHPAVRDVAVIALPDDVTGERACVVVTLRGPTISVTLDELCTFLAGHGLSRHKLPEQLEIIENMPRTATGKITKRFLQERFATDAQRNIASV